ncbi:MAG: hypothetical protein M3498_14195 [Deinococcota bacterium]|nr:hypothetical protein [Deinococcota bacterium]
MLRLALVVLVAVLGVLAVVALLPGRPQLVPDSSVRLERVNLNLYPEADPGARWRFAALALDYSPNSRESVLHEVTEGLRLVDGESDFTLCADEAVIDSRDNLRSQRIFVHFLGENIDMEMQGDGVRPVLINQDAGRFEIPRLNYSGEGLGENSGDDAYADFDLADFQVSNPRNQYIDGESLYTRENPCPEP